MKNRTVRWYEISSEGSDIVFEDGTREKYDPNKPKADTIWPVTIVKARYQGSYEGGLWLAFDCQYWQVPEAVYGDDISCSTFFDEYNKSNRKKNPLKIGRGETPEEALKDLVAQYYA